MLNVEVSTLVFGTGAGATSLPPVSLRLVSERVSAREIITRTVAEQIQALEELHKEDFASIYAALSQQYLSPDDLTNQAATGKVVLHREAARPRVELEVGRALRSFASKNFKIFLDGRELHKLDDEVTLIDGSSLTFVRLVPLVGG